MRLDSVTFPIDIVLSPICPIMPNPHFESLSKRLTSYTTDKPAMKATLEVESLRTEVAAVCADMAKTQSDFQAFQKESRKMLHELYQITSSLVDVTKGNFRFFSGTACDALEPHHEVKCTAGGRHTMTSECDTNGSEPRITDNCEDARSEPVQSRPSYRNAVLSSKDYMSTLEPFYGNADKKAEVIDVMHITHLHSWFEDCKWKMSAAQLSESQQVSIICQKLHGPILSAFMHASRTFGQPNSLAELRTALSQEFAQSSVKFSDEAREMVFSRRT